MPSPGRGNEPHDMRLGGERMERKLCGAKAKSGEPCKKAALANGRLGMCDAAVSQHYLRHDEA
ncbi:hypothetical protein J14TS5_03820 [Paenibacillus lautus]|nr:hypothetical protein J14TS5_03820 [Paenibacillus lautus]